MPDQTARIPVKNEIKNERHGIKTEKKRVKTPRMMFNMEKELKSRLATVQKCQWANGEHSNMTKHCLPRCVCVTKTQTAWTLPKIIKTMVGFFFVRIRHNNRWKIRKKTEQFERRSRAIHLLRTKRFYNCVFSPRLLTIFYSLGKWPNTHCLIEHFQQAFNSNDVCLANG